MRLSSNSHSASGFWLLYPIVTDYNALLCAVHALYYLPENYRLLIVGDEPSRQMYSLTDHSVLKSRLKFTQQTSFLYKRILDTEDKIVIYDQRNAQLNSAETTRTILITHDNSHAVHVRNHGFLTVDVAKPESLASAVLSLTAGKANKNA